MGRASDLLHAAFPGCSGPKRSIQEKRAPVLSSVLTWPWKARLVPLLETVHPVGSGEADPREWGGGVASWPNLESTTLATLSGDPSPGRTDPHTSPFPVPVRPSPLSVRERADSVARLLSFQRPAGGGGPQPAPRNLVGG